MMDLFNENGHLTAEGLNAVIAETLPELERLEAAEHLSFCDECLLKYSQLLTQDVLYTPIEPALPRVKKSLRQKFVHFTLARYTTVAAAVAFAFVLYSIGAFTNFVPTTSGIPDTSPPTAYVEPQSGLFEKITGAATFFFRNETINPPMDKSITPPEAPKIRVPKEIKIKIPDKTTKKPYVSEAAKPEHPKENPAKTKLKEDNPAKQNITAENPAQSILNNKEE